MPDAHYYNLDMEVGDSSFLVDTVLVYLVKAEKDTLVVVEVVVYIEAEVEVVEYTELLGSALVDIVGCLALASVVAYAVEEVQVVLALNLQ